MVLLFVSEWFYWDLLLEYLPYLSCFSRNNINESLGIVLFRVNVGLAVASCICWFCINWKAICSMIVRIVQDWLSAPSSPLNLARTISKSAYMTKGWCSMYCFWNSTLSCFCLLSFFGSFSRCSPWFYNIESVCKQIKLSVCIKASTFDFKKPLISV